MTTHLMIPDTQIRPGVPLQHLDHCNKLIRDRKPDKIIIIGDWWDINSLSSFTTTKESEERLRYSEDIESGREGLSRLLHKVKGPEIHFCEGNHEYRITRYIGDHPVHAGSMSIMDCNVEDWGIKRHPFLKPFVLDGVWFSHYFHPAHNSRNSHPSAKAMLQREHRSCVMGHVQTLDVDVQKVGDTKSYIRGIIAGSFYLHDEPYRMYQSNNHWRGVLFFHSVKAGMFDLEEFSIHRLKLEYG